MQMQLLISYIHLRPKVYIHTLRLKIFTSWMFTQIMVPLIPFSESITTFYIIIQVIMIKNGSLVKSLKKELFVYYD